MSNSAHVISIQYLVDLRIAIGQFREETQQSLSSIDIEIRRSQEWLKQKHDYWRKQVEHRKEEVSRAQQALSHCRSTKNSDCRSVQNKLAEALRALREAEKELETVRYWSQVIQQAITDYQKQAYRLEQQLQQDIPKAGTFLGRKIEELKGYMAVSPISGGVVSTTYASSTEHILAQIDESQKEISLRGELALPLSDEMLDGQPKNKQDMMWQEKGIQNVPVKYLIHCLDGERSHVKSKEDFDKVSYDYEDMVEGFRKLNSVVLPGVQEGASGDDFSQMDAQQGLDNEHGYRRIYDVFYGQDAIHVNKLGENCYDIDNGYHRIFVARDMGLETIPAKVAERVPLGNQ
jgi:flagellar biosynthesis regulator FlaF